MTDHAPRQDEPPVLIGEEAVARIPLVEIDEAMVDLATIPRIAIDPRLADPVGHHRMVRAGVAKRLGEAAASLPGELELLVIEGYRPLETQRRIFEAHLAELRPIYSQVSEAELSVLASRFVAPPTGIPPHCSGAAVDLTLAFTDGPELDMGTRVNEGPEESHGRCYSNATDIPANCRQNRAILFEALAGQGLVNYPPEWWHWSWGDRYWSLQKEAPAALYGLVDEFRWRQ